MNYYKNLKLNKHTGLGEPSTSTKHILQDPATANLSWKQKRGISTLICITLLNIKRNKNAKSYPASWQA